MPCPYCKERKVIGRTYACGYSAGPTGEITPCLTNFTLVVVKKNGWEVEDEDFIREIRKMIDNEIIREIRK